MKIIGYDTDMKKWSPRATIVGVVAQAVLTGFFLGAAFVESVRGRTVFAWIFPLVMGLSSIAVYAHRPAQLSAVRQSTRK
jgi:hypothetical protein